MKALSKTRYRAEGGNYAFTGALVDPNVFLPGGVPNPNFGKVYSASYLGRKIDGTFRDSRTVRVVVAYPIKGFGGVTNLSAFAHRQQTDSRLVYWDMNNADPRLTTPVTDNSRRINIYRYWDNITPALPDFSRLYTLRAVPSADGYTENANDAVEVAASGNYLGGRLSYVAGFRRDKSELTSRNVRVNRDELFYSGTSRGRGSAPMPITPRVSPSSRTPTRRWTVPSPARTSCPRRRSRRACASAWRARSR